MASILLCHAAAEKRSRSCTCEACTHGLRAVFASSSANMAGMPLGSASWGLVHLFRAERPMFAGRTVRQGIEMDVDTQIGSCFLRVSGDRMNGLSQNFPPTRFFLKQKET